MAVAFRGDVGGRSFTLGLIAGLGGGAGLAAFYRALSLGTMSVVSPVVACGAVVPFAISIATGERPSALAFAGAVAALGGAVLASVEERRASSPDTGTRDRARGGRGGRARPLRLLPRARQPPGRCALDPARCAGRVADAARRPRIGRGARRCGVPRPWLAAVVAVGLADVTANVLFAFAATHALLALVSVLGSLYPVVTVLLAHVLLGERLTRTQQAGVVIALAGVAAIAGG